MKVSPNIVIYDNIEEYQNDSSSYRRILSAHLAVYKVENGGYFVLKSLHSSNGVFITENQLELLKQDLLDHYIGV